jgi:hypothetical protein
VRITASNSYDLFLNGDYVARGPVPGDPRWCLYDELSFTPPAGIQQLHITIVAHHSVGTTILALLPAPGGVVAEVSSKEMLRCRVPSGCSMTDLLF